MNGAETLVQTLLGFGGARLFRQPRHLGDAFRRGAGSPPGDALHPVPVRRRRVGRGGWLLPDDGEVAATLLHLAPGFGNAFANLHNARKAQSGVLNIMGDHADYHLRFEAPLKGDTVGISQAISHWTRVCSEAGEGRQRCRGSGAGGAGEERADRDADPAGEHRLGSGDRPCGGRSGPGLAASITGRDRRRRPCPAPAGGGADDGRPGAVFGPRASGETSDQGLRGSADAALLRQPLPARGRGR
jgi:hypothetical protein